MADRPRVRTDAGESFILRVYRKGARVLGIAEPVEGGARSSFTDRDGLWNIVTHKPGVKPGRAVKASGRKRSFRD